MDTDIKVTFEQIKKIVGDKHEINDPIRQKLDVGWRLLSQIGRHKALSISYVVIGIGPLVSHYYLGILDFLFSTNSNLKLFEVSQVIKYAYFNTFCIYFMALFSIIYQVIFFYRCPASIKQFTNSTELANAANAGKDQNIYDKYMDNANFAYPFYRLVLLVLLVLFFSCFAIFLAVNTWHILETAWRFMRTLG